MRLRNCTCQHEYQDKKYGPGKRAMNPIPTTGGERYRCTVCGREHPGVGMGGGPASQRRRMRLEGLKMSWPEYIRKAGKR